MKSLISFPPFEVQAASSVAKKAPLTLVVLKSDITIVDVMGF